MNSKTKGEEPTVAPGMLGIHYTNCLFDRHGVKKADRTKVLMQESVFGLSYPAAHRRVNGETPWTIDDLRVLANHFGETLKELIDRADAEGGERAALWMGGTKKHCRVWLGPRLTRPAAPSDLVAVRQGKSVEVSIGSESSSLPCYRVEKLTLENAHRIAVLDDNRDVADGICDYLQRQGFDVDTYTNAQALRTEQERQGYDAFVLDWFVDKAPVVELISTIRARDPQCCIAVITGEIESGNVPPSDITEAAATHKFLYFLKPTNMAVISATLTSFLRLNEGA